MLNFDISMEVRGACSPKRACKHLPDILPDSFRHYCSTVLKHAVNLKTYSFMITSPSPRLHNTFVRLNTEREAIQLREQLVSKGEFMNMEILVLQLGSVYSSILVVTNPTDRRDNIRRAKSGSHRGNNVNLVVVHKL